MAALLETSAASDINFNISQAQVDKLEEDSFCIIDNVLQADIASSLLAELTWLTTIGFSNMIPNRTSFGSRLYTKPGIFELDLHQTAVRTQLKNMDNLFTESRTKLIPLLSRLGIENLSDSDDDKSRTIKLQFNNGSGGCFPYHYDNPGPPSNRLLTCILYLNREWEPEHGGELTLYPFLQQVVTFQVAHYLTCISTS